MTHPDREVLTPLALNEPLALDADALVHIADCDQCSAEIEALQRTASAAERGRDDAELRELVAPPESVWERIAHEAGLSGAEGGTITTVAEKHAPVEHVEPRPHLVPDAPPARRRVGAQLMAAAAVGIIVGALFTWILTDRDDDGAGSSGDQSTLTTSDLVGIDGHATSGVASFEETATGGQVTVELKPEDVGDGFIQAWLLDEDTGGMVALGVVDGDKGTFAVPPSLDLNAFNQIDISLEPYDGNPEHSSVSLARGPLP